jgi:hypothetical protein
MPPFYTGAKLGETFRRAFVLDAIVSGLPRLDTDLFDFAHRDLLELLDRGLSVKDLFVGEYAGVCELLLQPLVIGFERPDARSEIGDDLLPVSLLGILAIDQHQDERKNAGKRAKPKENPERECDDLAEHRNPNYTEFRLAGVSLLGMKTPIKRKRISEGSSDFRLLDAAGEDLGRIDGNTVVYPEKTSAGIVQGVNLRQKFLEEIDGLQKELATYKTSAKGMKPIDVEQVQL